MAREIRRVPKGWKHPVDEKGHYRPMFDRTYLQGLIAHFRHELLWYLWPPKHLRYIKEWTQGFPDRAYYRPPFRRGTAVCYQIYEDVTEGTPISPVFDTLDELKEWLIAEGYSRLAAENFAKDGWVPSLATIPGIGTFKDIECAATPRSSHVTGSPVPIESDDDPEEVIGVEWEY